MPLEVLGEFEERPLGIAMGEGAASVSACANVGVLGFLLLRGFSSAGASLSLSLSISEEDVGDGEEAASRGGRRTEAATRAALATAAGGDPWSGLSG